MSASIGSRAGVTPARVAIVGYETHAMIVRLRAELSVRGHRVDVVDPRHLATELLGGHESVVGLPPGRPDVAVLTVSTDQVAATRAVEALLRSGVPVLNPPVAVLRAADKFATASVLSAAGLPVPRTVNVCTADAVVRQGHRLGWPVVLKAADGSEGAQVVLIHGEPDVADAVARIRRSLGHDPTVRSSLVVQEFVAESVGHDRRMFVAGGAVRATMDRVARAGEWRSNLSLGGRPVAAWATAEETLLATRAVAALGLDFGTVDVMATATGPVIIEVNPFGDVLDVGMVNAVDLVGCLADTVEARAGVRSPDTVSARPLAAAELEALATFCWNRLDAKLVELGLAELSA
jgi:ribosomal protein S6--L-glutamate ligase